jgi:alpha-tubulin suppressor-like RCC1 family protein
MTQGALAGKTLTYISAGSDDACALDTRGKAYCWGADGDDELGNDETSNSKVPVAAFAGGCAGWHDAHSDQHRRLPLVRAGHRWSRHLLG